MELEMFRQTDAQLPSNNFCSAVGSVMRRRIWRPSVVGRTMSALCKMESSAIALIGVIGCTSSTPLAVGFPASAVLRCRRCFKANENLERDIAELLPRPVWRPSIKPLVEYKSFLYQAASWKKARRVVAKVEYHQGELFPLVGFIVTSLSLASRAVVRFYNKRGTAEQWIKEGKQAVKMTRLSCHRFRSNEVRLWLSVIAYNLGNLWRRLVLPKKIDHWSLTSLQQRLMKTGGRWPRRRFNPAWEPTS
jgi:hypothetical protein